MRLIAHRGNRNGPSNRENEPSYIEEALAAGYDVEIDVWFHQGGIWLGHDAPTYHVNPSFLKTPGLWCHAKNFAALNTLRICKTKHYFWHQEDDFTLTSSGYIWTYPGKQLSRHSIAVMPELIGDVNAIDKSIYGICTDYVSIVTHETCNI
jgi:hypothetical protein